jgi:hypothetical protein
MRVHHCGLGKRILLSFHQTHTMNLKHIISLLLLFIMANCQAQRYVSVMTQLFTVHSPGNIFVNSNSSSRNIIQVDFPAGTTGYIYRISSTVKSNTNSQATQLFDLLKDVAPAQIVMEATLTQFAISQIDGAAVDAFAFSTADDANTFLRKQDNYLRYCWVNKGVISTTYATDKCLNPTIYFGFRNNNLTTGINVNLEIVAIVDTAANPNSVSAYTYSIANGVDQSARYLISTDKVHWKSYDIRAGDLVNLTQDQPKVYLRLVTSLFNMVTYEIQPTQRYRIIWSNAKRWDLVTY